MEASPPAAAAPQQAQAHAAEAARKWIIAASVILCTILEVLDSSIVNVALPHMQGSFSATVDEVAWVVTTYLVAAGIMIPTTGWIAGQFGRKRYFLISITAFSARHSRRGAAAAFAGDPDGDLPAQRADARDGGLGIRADGRTHHGSDGRRLYHRQLELALELLHQCSDRDRRRLYGLDLRE
jgi:hypothetical protein